MRMTTWGVGTWLVAGALALGAAGLGACGDIIAPPTVGADAGPEGDTTPENRAPEFAPVDPQTAVEGVELSFSVHATDPDDGQVVTLAMTDGPDTAVFADGKFTWKPPLDTVDYTTGQVKVTVTFSATDDGDPQRAATLDVAVLVESNVDGDLLADSLDDDIDGDGIANEDEAAFGTDVALADTDGDQMGDLEDNCKIIANESQEDTDGDGAGNACDPCPNDPQDDEDSDGVCGDVDNCPAVGNAGQDNADGDALGDACDDCPKDADNDEDGDTVCGDVDNCPAVANQDQADGDSDGLGDGCDTCPADPLNDADDDGVCGDVDNCPEGFNPGQADDDGDGIGNTCDTCPGQPGTDVDVDGVCDDNCPNDANPGQENGDGDELGDVCDPCPADPDNDIDGDLTCGDVDNCPSDANPTQEDADGDGVGDVCDACPADPDNDADGDTVCGDVDNCPGVANEDQLDTDGDGLGDACDDDDDGDGVLDGDDSCPKVANAGQEDMDGDGVGDVCDPDADGDGILTADGDNCPLAANPDQDDMDGDGVGLACDESVTIDPALLPEGTSFDALGDARGETLALVISSASDTATAITLEGGTQHLAKGAWLKLSPGGFVAEPRVDGSGASYFRGVDNLGGVHLDGVTGGAMSPVFGSQTLNAVPDLVPAPNGTIWAAVDSDISGLYELEGASAGPAHAKTSIFTDHGGQGPLYGGDGFLYLPYQAAVGGNASVAAVGPGGAGADPLISYDELYYLETDPGDGGPWFCARLYASGSPLFVHLVQGQLAASATLTGPSSCAGLSQVYAPETGIWWVADEASGTAYRWDSGSTASDFDNVYKDSATTAMTLTTSGEQCYLDASCGQGCHDIYRYSQVTQGFSLIGSLDAYYPKRVAGANGMYGIVGRDALSGLADIVGLLAEPQSAGTFNFTNMPSTSPVVQAANLTANGVLWVAAQVKQTDGTTKRQLGAVYGGPGGLTVDPELLSYQTATMVTSSYDAGLAPYALVSVDGPDAGVYVAEHGPNGSLGLGLAQPSVGTHKGFLATPGSTWGADAWFNYPSGVDGTGQKTWAVAKLSADGNVSIQRTGLTASVKRRGALGAGHPWLVLSFPEGLVGATIDETGLGDITEPKSELTTLYRLRSQDDVWGTLSRASAGEPPVVCALTSAAPCWTLPAGDYGLLWGPYVTGADRVFAVTRDVTDATHMTIWRNVGPPDPPQQ